MRRQLLAGAAGLLTASAVAGCAGAGTLGQGSGDKTTVVVAIVSNPQMEDAIELSPDFEEENPDINVEFVSLPENEARAKITASVATGGGGFDVVMISNYETPQWAKNGWLTNLQPYADETEGYGFRRLHPVDPRVAVVRGRPLLGAVLRRVELPRLPQGHVRGGRRRDAGQPDLARGGRPRRRARRPRQRRLGYLPARAGRVGREPRCPSTPSSTPSVAGGSTRTGRPSSTARRSPTPSTSTSTWCRTTASRARRPAASPSA